MGQGAGITILVLGLAVGAGFVASRRVFRRAGGSKWEIALPGRTVVVRINDRGPHVRNRVIDLSRGAAEALGMVGLGLKPVELFALDEDEKDCPAAP